MELNSKLFDEYKALKEELLNDENIIATVAKKSELHQQLSNADKYTKKYDELKVEYDNVSNLLAENESYARFKVLERELNMFIMYCNKELEKLFDLNKKGCEK